MLLGTCKASQCPVFKQVLPPWLPFRSQSPVDPAGSPRPHGYFYRRALCLHSLRKVFASVERAAGAKPPFSDQHHACLFLPLTQDSRDTALLPSKKNYPALQIHLGDYRRAWGPAQFLLLLGCRQLRRAQISGLLFVLGLQIEARRVAEP